MYIKSLWWLFQCIPDSIRLRHHHRQHLHLISRALSLFRVFSQADLLAHRVWAPTTTTATTGIGRVEHRLPSSSSAVTGFSAAVPTTDCLLPFLLQLIFTVAIIFFSTNSTSAQPPPSTMHLSPRTSPLSMWILLYTFLLTSMVQEVLAARLPDIYWNATNPM